MPRKSIELYKLPPDVEAWEWHLNHAKAGPRKNPGGWFQFMFSRRLGLAKGDEDLDSRDDLVRVKVRRPPEAEAFTEAIRQMRERSAHLERSDAYERIMDQNKRNREHVQAFADARRREALGEP